MIYLAPEGVDHRPDADPLSACSGAAGVLMCSAQNSILDGFRALADRTLRNSLDGAGVRELCDRLSAYLTLREEVVLPVVAGLLTGPKLRERFDECVIEHYAVRFLFETLEGDSPEDHLFRAKLSVLHRSFARHVRFEQRFLFAALGVETGALLDGAIRRSGIRLEPVPRLSLVTGSDG
ncbi:MAG TPA: hypothetical protein VKY53_05450 [Marinobacter sp.]|nr:hypothetical protein [Marinobacter sp.]